MKTLLLLLLLGLLWGVLPSAAQEPAAITADEVNAIARQLYCPVCENVPLDVCPTAACDQWRSEIRTQLAEGRTTDQIIDDFIARYGDRVVGTPQDPLLRALSLVTPWLIGLLLAAVMGAVLWRWRRSRVLAGTASAPSANALSDGDYRARLERDLQARR